MAEGDTTVILHGVSVFAHRPGVEIADVLRRFPFAPSYAATTIGELRAAGFQVLPTGGNVLVDRQRRDELHVEVVDESCAEAETMGVDIVGDPHRESDEGYNWTRLAYARNVRDVTPGSAVVMGSSIGHYLAKVVAWDFEVSDDDPIVVLDLVPLRPDAVERALARRNASAA